LLARLTRLALFDPAALSPARFKRRDELFDQAANGNLDEGSF